ENYLEMSKSYQIGETLKSRIRLLEDTQCELKQKCQKQMMLIKVMENELSKSKSMTTAHCGICENSPIDSIFLPCNHAFACQNCALKCETCPICRGKLGK